MAIDPQVLKNVMEERQKKQRVRETELFRRKEQIYRQIPEIARIEGELKRTMAHLSRAIFDGDGNIDRLIADIRENNEKLQAERKALLTSAGYPEDYLVMRPNCEICNDTGYVGATPCDCLTEECRLEQTKELSYLLNTGKNDFSTFNYNYYSAKTDDRYGFSPRENMKYIYDRCMEFAVNFGKKKENLLLMGGTGLGKTFLSGCIAKVVAMNGFSVVYDTAVHIISCMERDKFGNSQNEENAFQLRRISSCDLLIIDDLGSEMQTSFTISAVYTILNDRIMSNSPMIVNTNLMPDEIGDRYNSQIESRLMGGFSPLNFFGTDIRLIKNGTASAE